MLWLLWRWQHKTLVLCFGTQALVMINGSNFFHAINECKNAVESGRAPTLDLKLTERSIKNRLSCL